MLESPPGPRPTTRLRATRQATGLGLGAFARQIGYDRPTLIRVETGQLAASAPLRKRLAAALGVDEAWLFGDVCPACGHVR